MLFALSSSERYGNSVGRTGPTSVSIWHLQAPQLPRPPQAEGRYIPSEDKEERSASPPFISSSFLPLFISIFTSP